MVILDTDHISLVLIPGSEAAMRILARLASTGLPQMVTTIVTFEEQTRGWLGKVAGAKGLPQVIEAYGLLNRNLDAFRSIRVLDFDEPAAAVFQKLRSMKLHVGTMDLRIAAIALTHDATLLSRNRKDFGKIPGLKLEDRSL